MTPEVSPGRARAALVVLSLAAFAFITTELLPIGLLTSSHPTSTGRGRRWACWSAGTPSWSYWRPYR